MHTVLVFSARKGTTIRHIGRERTVSHSTQERTAGEEDQPFCQAERLSSHSALQDPLKSPSSEGTAGWFCQTGVAMVLVVVFKVMGLG